MASQVVRPTVEDLSRLFGAPPDEVQSLCGDVLAGTDLGYRVIEGDARDEVIVSVLKRIFSKDLPTAGKDRQPDWDKGWQENLDEFVVSGYDFSKLVPKYFKKRVPARLEGKWVYGESENFVFDMTHVYRTWLFRKYFGHMDAILEFGCGPAYHLAYLARLFPGKPLCGFDWASSSNHIVDLLAERFGWPLRSGHFDFFNPDSAVTFPPNSGVYTFGALEQVHDKHGRFLDFLLERSPALVVNVECLHELYDQDDLADCIALAYHRRRHYLEGYLTRLKELEQAGRIEILKIHHFRFGNMNDDPLSHVVWKPTNMDGSDA